MQTRKHYVKCELCLSANSKTTISSSYARTITIEKNYFIQTIKLVVKIKLIQ